MLRRTVRPSRHVLLRQFKRNGFGRERDADRIAEVWQDWNTYGALPRHAPACDIVGLTADGTYTSLAGVADVLLLTDYLPGRPYADDLHRIFEMWSCDQADLARALGAWPLSGRDPQHQARRSVAVAAAPARLSRPWRGHHGPVR